MVIFLSLIYHLTCPRQMITDIGLYLWLFSHIDHQGDRKKPKLASEKAYCCSAGSAAVTTLSSASLLVNNHLNHYITRSSPVRGEHTHTQTHLGSVSAASQILRVSVTFVVSFGEHTGRVGAHLLVTCVMKHNYQLPHVHWNHVAG